MADTSGDPDQRTSARRQLAKWAKIMCQIVGLERVAEELMGRREWSTYQDIMVGQDTKGGEPICPAPLRPAQHITHSVREGSRSPMAGGWYIRPASPEPQPLDLSSKPPKPPTSPNKTIFKAKPRLPGVGGRRSYTEDELQAALRDIQSGKLGTRRAAVIYGIPRSTLRNKVYKISQESCRDFEEEEEEETSGAEEERETEQLLNRPLTVHDILRLSSEVRASWPCLQQLLTGASTSAEEQPLRGFVPPARNGEGSTPPPQPPQPQPPVIGKEQPLDFRRNHNNNNTTSANNNNNHLEDKKGNGGKQQQQGGKGTRPKRGKYRNYDRDSLVEAVRAVQRGEMSVHRAGSYYGVPHSTLEYKVKERHLMRPRKREPKPQPPPEEKRKEEEKRVPVVGGRPALTPPPPIPNGLKMPAIFDPSPLQFRAPFPPYWQTPFLFGRPELYPPELRRPPQPQVQEDGSAVPLSKSAREMAESLLETAESGSFLDGIIRSSLDTGLPVRESGGKVLLEQLCRGGPIERPASPPASPPRPPAAPRSLAASPPALSPPRPEPPQTPTDNC